MTTTYTTPETGRDIDWATLKAQIGFGNLCAISGGRAKRIDASTIDLPVSAGYRVRVHLAGNDTYTVSRVLVRGAKTFVKGSVVGVHCDGIGEIAYRASCYRDGEFGQ